MEEIVIEESNYKALALLLASFFMLSASVAIAVYGHVGHRNGFRTIGILASALFTVCFIAAIHQVTKVKKLITITTDGIIDHSAMGGLGFISYGDIKDMRVVSVYNKEAIAFKIKNMDRFLSKLSVVKRRQIIRNVSLNLPPVVIFVNMAKDMEPEDILSLLKKRHLDYNRLYE